MYILAKATITRCKQHNNSCRCCRQRQKRGCYQPKHLYLPPPVPKTRSPPAKAIEIAAVDARKRRLVMKAKALAVANAGKEAATSQSNNGCPSNYNLPPPIMEKRLPPAKVFVVTPATSILLPNAAVSHH